MTEIRSFKNCDLPVLADVWIQHWSTIGPVPRVSVSTIEQAILSRTFFRADTLLVATQDESVVAWCHYQPDAVDAESAVICAVCFSPEQGLGVCDPLLQEVEARIARRGFRRILVGLIRDKVFGYAGLAPVGYGAGIPSNDSRTTSLLSRNSYQIADSFSRLVVSTSPYRAPINRDLLKLRRTTRTEEHLVFPETIAEASAISHLDIERHQLIDHRSREELASIDFWLSDPEAQVMSCSNAIMDLGEIHDRGKLRQAETFLIASTVQTLANRRVFTIETVVDQDHAELIDQLKMLSFEMVEQGDVWVKNL